MLCCRCEQPQTSSPSGCEVELMRHRNSRPGWAEDEQAWLDPAITWHVGLNERMHEASTFDEAFVANSFDQHFIASFLQGMIAE